MKNIAVINGPNLNTLGNREPALYGLASLADIEADLKKQFQTLAHIRFFQSNHEGALIDHLQSLQDVHGIVVNPGAFTHTSIAIRDALVATNISTIEVHISNIYQRESFRHHSYFSDICLGVICGLGVQGYKLAIEGLLHLLANQASH